MNRDYQWSSSRYISLVGIPGSHLSAKPIPWMGAFPEHIQNSCPKSLFPWWWISSKSISIKCVTLLPQPNPKSGEPQTFGIVLLTHRVLHNFAQELVLDSFLLFPSSPSTNSWFRAWPVCLSGFFLDILLAVALVQFITQQLLGNPLSSPPWMCTSTEPGAACQQNRANPSLLWGLRWCKGRRRNSWRTQF